MKCCCLMIGGWRIGDGSEADIALALSFVCGYFDSDCALPVVIVMLMNAMDLHVIIDVVACHV